MKHLYRQLTWPEARDRAAAGAVIVIPVAAIGALVLYPPDARWHPCRVTRRVRGGDSWHVGGVAVRVVETPGHSADGVTYLFDTPDGLIAFPSDTVFAGGRVLVSVTPDCHPAALDRSLRLLAELPIAGLDPGHGESVSRGPAVPRPAAAAAELPDLRGAVVSERNLSAVRVAVCGLGNIGTVHLANLLTLRGCAVSGVYDTDRKQAVARRFDVPAYRDWPALLADRAADAVVLATPAADHRRGVLDCLEAGQSVFVEKPLAETADDARAVVAAAARSNVPVQVGFCERFNPSFLEAKAAVPRLGRVASVQSSRVAPLALSDPAWRLGPLDTAIHNFDLICWLTGRRPLSVTAHAARLYADAPGPTAVTTVIRFDGVLTAVGHVAWVRDARHPLAACARARMTLYGDAGVFDIDLSSRPASLLTSDGYTQPDTVTLGRPDDFGCLRLQLDAFLRAVETGASPVPAADGLRAELLAIAALHTLERGHEVAISEDAWPSYTVSHRVRPRDGYCGSMSHARSKSL